jgi:hypothetical protein
MTEYQAGAFIIAIDGSYKETIPVAHPFYAHIPPGISLSSGTISPPGSSSK